MRLIWLIILISASLSCAGCKKMCAPKKRKESSEAPLLSDEEKTKLHRQFAQLLTEAHLTRKVLKQDWKKDAELLAILKAGLPVNEEFFNDTDANMEHQTMTHLWYATFHEDEESAAFLLKNQADHSIRTETGSLHVSPLYLASYNNSMNILKKFLAYTSITSATERSSLLTAAGAQNKKGSDAIKRLIEQHSVIKKKKAGDKKGKKKSLKSPRADDEKKTCHKRQKSS